MEYDFISDLQWLVKRCLIPTLVLNAAAACPIFGLRSARAHYLQPPAQLGLTLSQRSLDRVPLQLWCRDNKQRVSLMCCSCLLSILAFRLARDVRSEHWVVGNIMRRCFSVYALRLLIDQFDHNSCFGCEADDTFCDDWVVKLMRRNESEVDEDE
jgi:hypothetical protein